MSKAEYRRYFRIMKKYVELTVICKEIGVNCSNLSHFLNDETGGTDWIISLDKLEQLHIACKSRLIEIV